MTVRVTADGLNELAAHLEAAAEDVGPEAKKVLAKAAFNIKRDAQKKASGIAHAPNYPRTISYDTWWRGEVGRAEIGPDKDIPHVSREVIVKYATDLELLGLL